MPLDSIWGRPLCYSEDHGKVIEKTLPGQFCLECQVVLGIVPLGGPWGTVPELLFEKKGLIPAVQQLLVSHLWLQARE
jgi:hypothetical protein